MGADTNEFNLERECVFVHERKKVISEILSTSIKFIYSSRASI